MVQLLVGELAAQKQLGRLGIALVVAAPLILGGLAFADGSVLLGTSPNGKIVRVMNDRPAPFAETGALAVTSMLEGANGVVYAATIPDGRSPLIPCSAFGVITGVITQEAIRVVNAEAKVSPDFSREDVENAPPAPSSGYNRPRWPAHRGDQRWPWRRAAARVGRVRHASPGATRVRRA